MKTGRTHPRISQTSWLSLHLFLSLPLFFLTGCFYQRSAAIDQSISQLESELATLPLDSLNLAPWTLGYRSEGQDDPESAIELVIHFDQPTPIDLVALIPATFTDDGRRLEAYCFPERFVIEYQGPDGSYHPLADYSQKDYLIRGIEPQLFQLPEKRLASRLRVRISRLSENHTWSRGKYRAAISEIMVFSGDWNIALNQKVICNSNSEYSYIWSPEAIVDGFSVYSAVDRAPENPNTTPLRIRNVESATITYDFGKVSQMNEIRLWPLVHDLQFNYPPSSGLGFPRGIELQLADDPTFENALTILKHDEVYPRAGSNPLMLKFPPASGRYLKIQLDHIVYDYRTRISELALDEIQLFHEGRNLSSGILPEIRDISVAAEERAALTDGRTSEGIILPLRQSLVDFARSAEIRRRLNALEKEKDIAQAQDAQRVTFSLGIAIGIAIILTLSIFIVYLLSERRWRVARERIACDLHDDLGANMISVAHSMELIQHNLATNQEKCSSLLRNAIDVAFRTAEETRQIVRLLEKKGGHTKWTESVQQSAQQILGSLEYSLEIDHADSLNGLNALYQRNILLFLKEALNNVVKHANAQSVSIRFIHEGRNLILLVEDDGKGWEQEKQPAFHLQQRAKRLKGKLTVTSSHHNGTSIRLELAAQH
ncbi:MAG: histidine kinase [Verrucomicrobiota bacterium]